MKTRTHLLSTLATLAFVAVVSWGSALNAQTTPSSNPADQQQQTQQPSPDAPPAQTPQTQPAPAPEMPPATQQTPSSTSPNQTQAPATEPQTPSTPSQMPPTSTPDQTPAPSATAPAQAPTATPQTATSDASGDHVFAGTVVKSGDKYMLKDDSGKTYDIDHQDDVKKFEGKRVRVQGALDSTGTKILVK